MEMLATGWPLALFGFFIGILVSEFTTRAKKTKGMASVRLKPGESPISALQLEIDKAKQLLQADAEETRENEETLRQLDEAIKRANGRLKLIMKSVDRSR
ncbi:hypothetical protein PUV54_00845 [Hyphococcus flavus]|uniref:Uncharacterized protein n=1 Tax=Hyphococcus flavus TaxID=1866326 RepID=A0AAF0CBS7_9PROT|nr:hypothetical protein [Hyphococcus flavus]WDI31735.1 hypothetical protein PUV54_00845 [Hyphococcus flavus]